MAQSTHNPDYQLLLTVLKAASKRVGVSQVDLAERLGNTQTFVSKCERGERRIDAVELVEFAEALGDAGGHGLPLAGAARVEALLAALIDAGQGGLDWSAIALALAGDRRAARLDDGARRRHRPGDRRDRAGALSRG